MQMFECGTRRDGDESKDNRDGALIVASIQRGYNKARKSTRLRAASVLQVIHF